MGVPAPQAPENAAVRRSARAIGGNHGERAPAPVRYPARHVPVDRQGLGGRGFGDPKVRFMGNGVPCHIVLGSSLTPAPVDPNRTDAPVGADRPVGPIQSVAPKFVAGSISGTGRPRGRAASGRSHRRNSPLPRSTRSSPPSTTRRPRERTVTGHPLMRRPS